MIKPINTNLTISSRPLLEWVHADTCLPDYWGGHHLPHVQIPVSRGLSMKEIKSAIRDELRNGYVAGSCDAARLLSADYVLPEDEAVAHALTRAVYAAVNKIKPTRKGQRKFFMDLEPEQEDDDSVYAYFVLRDRY